MLLIESSADENQFSKKLNNLFFLSNKGYNVKQQHNVNLNKLQLYKIIKFLREKQLKQKTPNKVASIWSLYT